MPDPKELEHHWDDDQLPMEKTAAEMREFPIGALSRGVYKELRNGAPHRELATKIAMENLRRDPGYYEED